MASRQLKFNYRAKGTRAVRERLGSHVPHYRDPRETPYLETRDGRIEGDAAALWLIENNPRRKRKT